MADDDDEESDNAYISHDNNDEEIEDRKEIEITLEQQPSLLDLEVDQAVHFEKET